ncbi:MAG: aminomethyl-transferring glycine dehydrogenase subunit GcvPA [Candidatus Margulisbacteria bacterium]|nr:aminomethyl-transferring glycine dehydrogenase subunit GcvPA [Candidatus Margulisiibacteriota bacterium]MBU1021970.1 aminomethyl-transferring glycine dehydrogenase subunit GcvPA [Candidatus Margulisiibacteriota bacterium]MBU1728949.1 aminomethyl-transferring glycine dehydrogenase subunit GcvPA [Candidatus Margulisiibacteriota bacterium]MBU1954755.1 aminomethyl-transferring glycine dehydrogenase subunit GcvPA [Candidatus Margulisiibacteriota bacterium]
MNTYSPLTKKDKQTMLSDIGASSVAELFADTPKEKLVKDFSLPSPISEIDLDKELKNLSAKNYSNEGRLCFLGAGAYNHFIPAAVNHLVKRSEFYTAYTPYQPEMSQGMLQAIFEYQTYICMLAGMDVANASLYDGATALAEAAAIAYHKTNRKKLLVSRVVHPERRAVLKTYAGAADKAIEEIPYDKNGATDLNALEKMLGPDVAGVVIPQVNFFGVIEDLSLAKDAVKKNGSLFIATFDPISMGIVTPPGELGVDIAVGEGQSLGGNISFGGPCLGLFACTKELIRYVPGRLVGQTVDDQNRRGFVLTLQAREQHIRREKAASNICSNEALNALSASVYLSLLGKNGLKKVAELCLSKANYLKAQIEKTKGFSGVFVGPIFKEFVVKTSTTPKELNKKLAKSNIIGGLDLEKFYPELKNHWLLCVTEVLSKEEIDQLVGAIKSAG